MKACMTAAVSADGSNEDDTKSCLDFLEYIFADLTDEHRSFYSILFTSLASMFQVNHIQHILYKVRHH